MDGKLVKVPATLTLQESYPGSNAYELRDMKMDPQYLMMKIDSGQTLYHHNGTVEQLPAEIILYFMKPLEGGTETTG